MELKKSHFVLIMGQSVLWCHPFLYVTKKHKLKLSIKQKNTLSYRTKCENFAMPPKLHISTRYNKNTLSF